MKGQITRSVILEGVRPIMFDRYPGDNKTKLLPEQKMYYDSDGNLVVPSENIQSFLSAERTKSAVKMFYDARKYKTVASALLGFVIIEPFQIPLLRNGKKVKFKGFDKDGIWLHKSVARLKDGIPNPKERPVVDLPWELHFKVTLIENDFVSEQEVKLLFEKGGVPIGLGTYRGVYGKFIVKKWV